MTTAANPDLTETRFVLPPDAKCLQVVELSARLRARIGPVEDDQSVITRPGARVTAKLITATLAALIAEFREPRLITDAVLQFSRTREQDPSAVLDVAFDAIARLIDGRILVPEDAIDARASEPGLAAGQAFGTFEIDAVMWSLDDTEVYRARSQDGTVVALKIAREKTAAVAALLGHEATILQRLNGAVTPKLLAHGIEQGRSFIAMEWCEGVSVAIAAQQARAARDRSRLHRLVRAMFESYSSLHASGVLHGDIHPGNCLVADNGTVTLIDFGRASLIDAGDEIDPARAGIPQFYDPAMAEALLAGRLPPACTELSEQYSVCVLAYLLLTGRHPIDAPAVQEDLLQRIAARPPLPFATRGIAAWPAVERVLRRGMARQPADRFENMSGLARSFAATALAATSGPPRSAPELETAIEQTRRLAHSILPPLHRAWFALRAAMALEDAELLAAAAVLIEDAGADWIIQSVATRIAHARSDTRLVRQCFRRFLDSGPPTDRRDTIAAILASAEALEGTALRDDTAAELGRWASQHLHRLFAEPQQRAAGDDAYLMHAALTLAKAGAVSPQDGLAERLDAIDADEASVWEWAAAYDLFAREDYRQRALDAPRPRQPLARAFALLRLHQLTGEMQWVAAAHDLLTELAPEQAALLAIELRMPECAVLPSFLLVSNGYDD